MTNQKQSVRKKGKGAKPRTQAAQSQWVDNQLDDNHVSGEHQRAVRAMMDPESSTGFDIPSRAPWLRTAVVESTTVSINEEEGTLVGGKFIAVVRARPDHTVNISSDLADASDKDTMDGQLQDLRYGNSFVVANKWGLVHGSKSEQAAEEAVVAGGSVYGIRVVAAGAGSRIFYVTAPTRTGRLKVDLYSGAANALVFESSSTECPFGIDGSSTCTMTFTADTTFLVLSYVTPKSTPMFTANVGFWATTGSAALSLQATSKEVNLKTMDGINNLRAYRVAGQSVLFRYLGSQFQNGGRVAIARVWSSWVPELGTSVYDSIALLPPSQRYLGRMSKGAHSFWVPSSVEDLEPKIYGHEEVDLRPGFKIVVAGDFDDPTEGGELQVQTIIEYSTDYPAYASKDYAPAWNSFDVAIEAMARMNPNGENPSHLAKVAKFMHKGVRKALKMAIDNPDKVAQAIMMIGKLLI